MEPRKTLMSNNKNSNDRLVGSDLPLKFMIAMVSTLFAREEKRT